MKYLPFEKIIFSTPLPPDEVLARIHENLEPKKQFRFRLNPDHKPYEGSIDGMSFDIRRLIGHRNSFLPRITGSVKSTPQGTGIHVKMKLHTFVFVFMIIWFGGIGITLLAVIIRSFNGGASFIMILVPALMLLFGYGLTMGGFKYESARSKKDLVKLLEAEIEH